MSTTVKLGDLALTGVDEYGCRWRTVSPIEGWDGSPSSTLVLTQKPRQPGAWRGPKPVLTPRVVTLHGIVKAPNATQLEAALDRLNEAASIDSLTPLAITRGAGARTCQVYRDGEVL